MRLFITMFSMLLVVGAGTISASSKQQPEEGEMIELRTNNNGQEGIPKSLTQKLSAYYYADSQTMVVTCQGYGCATVSIMSPTMQTLDSDFIDPDITPVACLSTPSIPGQYYIFIVTSSFTAYGTFAVE